MVALVVKPINLSEQGSYRERRRFMRLLKRLRDVPKTQEGMSKEEKEKSEAESLSLFEEADALLTARLTTDDGSPVEDALDALSANQFDQLLSAVAFEGGVGEASTVPSTNGTGGTVPSLPIG